MKLKNSLRRALIKVVGVPALLLVGALAVVACVTVDDSGECPNKYGSCDLLTGNTYVSNLGAEQGGSNVDYLYASGVKVAACTYDCNGSQVNVGYAFQAVGTCP